MPLFSLITGLESASWRDDELDLLPVVVALWMSQSGTAGLHEHHRAESAGCLVVPLAVTTKYDLICM
jgi:hypothetical protein